MRYIILAKTKSRSCKVSFILPWDVDLFATVQVRTITLNHNRSRNVLTSNTQEWIPLGFNQPIKRCERLRNQTSVYFAVFGTRSYEARLVFDILLLIPSRSANTDFLHDKFIYFVYVISQQKAKGRKDTKRALMPKRRQPRCTKRTSSMLIAC